MGDSHFSDQMHRLVFPTPPCAEAQTSDKWYHGGSVPTEQQGWKLYLSSSLENIVETIDIALEVFELHGVHYKYCKNEVVFRRMNAGLLGYSQIGKNVVGYFDCEERLKRVVVLLKQKLEPFRDTAPTIPYAIPVGGGLPMSYRFGAFHGDTVTIGNETYPDNREKPATWVFDHLADPLLALREEKRTDREFKKLLLSYPIFEVLSQSGKGGVFAAFDTNSETFKEVILKVGYKNGQILPDGRDGRDLIDAEWRFYREMEKRQVTHLAPKAERYLATSERSVLILERIEGANLQALHLDNKLSWTDLNSALDVLSSIHDSGLYVGDAKLSNFMRDEDRGRICALDFECGGFIQNGSVDRLCTFFFCNPSIEDLRTLDRVHFLYSILHPVESGTFTETDRIIELGDFIRQFRVTSELEEQILSLLRREIEQLRQ